MTFLFGFLGRARIVRLLLGVFFLSLSDLLGIAVIFPYLKVVADPSLIGSNHYLAALYAQSGLGSHEHFIYALSAALLLVFTLKTLLTLMVNRAQIRSLAGIGHQLTTTLFGMLIRARYDFFIQRAPSELIGMNYSYSSQVVVCLQAWLGMINEATFFVLMIGAALYVQPLATLVVVLLMGGVGAAMYRLVIRRIVRYGREQGAVDGRRHRLTFAVVSSIKDLKIMGLEDVFHERTVENSDRTRELAWRSNFATAFPRISIEYMIIAGAIVAAVVVMRSGMSMEKMLPLIGLMALAALRVLPAFGRLTTYYGTFRYSKTYLDRLEDFYRTLDKHRHDVVHAEIPFTRSIEVRNLDFSHGEKRVLRDLSMRIERGHSIGIVGASGSGKSTFLDVLTGLQEAGGGQFFLDGVAVEPYATDVIRRLVGYVPQQIALVDESIAFNICFTHEYDKEKIERVLKTANLAAFVSTLPDGIETSVGEGGTRLSGGQKQRLGIARALYRDPDILIFDEATSALDNITERELSDEIQALAGKKTLIIVAHRLTTIMGCDLIYVMDQGRIVASGTHAELLEKSALYRDMNSTDRSEMRVDEQMVS